MEYRETYKWVAANFFDGIIDELAFYGTALTEAEVANNYRAIGLSVEESPAINCLFTGDENEKHKILADATGYTLAIEYK